MKNTLQEKFLLFQIRTRRDPEAFARIYDTYAATMYRFIAYKVSSKEIAEDLASETFLKAWQYLVEGKRVESVRALLYTVARNLVIDHYRSKAKLMGDISLDETLLLDDDLEGLPAAEVVQKDIDATVTKEMVRNVLQKIRQSYRDVIVMKYLDQLSTAEIAAVLGKPSGQVRVLLHRALIAVKAEMQKEPDISPYRHESQQPHNSTLQPREERSRDVAVSRVGSGESRNAS